MMSVIPWLQSELLGDALGEALLDGSALVGSGSDGWQDGIGSDGTGRDGVGSGTIGLGVVVGGGVGTGVGAGVGAGVGTGDGVTAGPATTTIGGTRCRWRYIIAASRRSNTGFVQRVSATVSRTVVQRAPARSSSRFTTARDCESSVPVKSSSLWRSCFVAIGAIPRPDRAERGVEPIGELVHHRIVGRAALRRRGQWASAPARAFARLAAWPSTLRSRTSARSAS